MRMRSDVIMNNREPYWVEFEASPLGAKLSVDFKPGPNTAQQLNEQISGVNPVTYDINANNIFLGAESDLRHSGKLILLERHGIRS